MSASRLRGIAPRRGRRKYKKPAIEITSIEFVPMSERERQQAIAVLAELFMPLVHHSPRQRGRTSHAR